MKLCDYLPGRWSPTRPASAGVYLVRLGAGSAPWVAYWADDASSPFSVATRREFFHLEDDQDGQPTRWDAPSIAQRAAARGWTDRARGS